MCPFPWQLFVSLCLGGRQSRYEYLPNWPVTFETTGFVYQAFCGISAHGVRTCRILPAYSIDRGAGTLETPLEAVHRKSIPEAGR